MPETTTPAQLTEAIQSASLQKSIICLHSSLKSFGMLAGGPDTLIQAFLAADCTLLVPTFTYPCNAPPPPNRHIPQNAYDYSQTPDVAQSEVYDKDSLMISREMGAIPARVLQTPGCVRGVHPLNSFAAIGPLAEALITQQTLFNVYGPFKAAYAHPPAHLVMVGTLLTSATPIHFAEEKAGRRLFRRWAKNADGALDEVAVGSCSDGFENLTPAVSGIETRIHVGPSLWRIFPFKAFIDQVVAAITTDPQITHCADPYCSRCNDLISGGPLLMDEMD